MSERSERLSEHLSEIDTDLLLRAYAVDDADKLAALVKKEKKPFHRTAAFKRTAAAIAACIPLVGILGIGALLFRGEEPARTPLPWESEISEVNIESLDALNYYAAVHLLASARSIDTANSNAAAGGYAYYASAPLSGGAARADVYEYEIDPDEVFTVNAVIFFRVEITEEDGFLASRIGCGTVDVVITENSLEPMITFKNGDRYFSCLENGHSAREKSFSTHKYIDGFRIVKNLEQENYTFRVSFEDLNAEYRGTRAVDLCVEGASADAMHADGRLTVAGETYLSRESASFTVRELETHFDGAAPPVTSGRRLYTNGSYQFVFHEDGSFRYQKKSGAHYREGHYYKSGERIYLRFLTDGKTAEITLCEPVVSESDEGFYYGGEAFVLQKEGS